MDKSWMSAHRLSSKYEEGVESFINFAILNSTKLNLIRCPCIKCGNLKFLDPKTIKDHLFVNGVLKSYTIWFWHGETTGSVHVEGDSESGFEYGDGLDAVDMVEAVFREYDNKPDSFIKLLADAENPFYSRCSTHTVLSTLVRLYNLKAKHGWSDNSFSELLSLLADVLPDPNEIPRSSYEAKKTLSSLGMDYKKIHACPNDCILYRGEYAELRSCPVCGVSRWKITKNLAIKDGVPAKVLWYFPPFLGSKECLVHLM
ncbi:hypothetical protein UlMin_017406 [Ulmus minor]